MKNLKKFSVTLHSKNGATEKVFSAWDAPSAFDQAEKYAFANGYGVGTMTEIENCTRAGGIVKWVIRA